MRTRVGVEIVALALALSVVAIPGAVTADVAHPGDGAVDPAVDATDAVPARQSNCSFPYETADATGTDVRLGAEPERVVTLNPSAAQTMWEIGARGKVVGLTKYASYLDGAGTRANVSGSTDIVVVEQVVALEPDLVLAPNATSRETVEQLRGAGLTVYHFPEAGGIDDVYAKTRTIGRLTGACSEAEEATASMEERLGTVRRAVDGEPRPDVLYAFFGYTAGRGTFIHSVIEAAGGNNVAAEHNVTGYRKLNPEVVVEADPDWIVRNSNDPVMPEGAPFNSTTAVREGQVVVVPIQHLNQPAPRLVRGITTLAEHFHPEAYATANGTTTETAARTPVPTSTMAPATTSRPSATETPGQPGFGVVAGVLALSAAVLLLRGRP